MGQVVCLVVTFPWQGTPGGRGVGLGKGGGSGRQGPGAGTSPVSGSPHGGQGSPVDSRRRLRRLLCLNLSKPRSKHQP